MPKKAKEQSLPLNSVVKAELSEDKKGLRIALVVILLVVGVGLLAFAVSSLLGQDNGYREVEPENSPFADSFVLNYDIGASGASASVDYRRVREVYTDALNKYSKIFSSDTEYSDIKNIHYINTHPNEEIVVDARLYSALSKMEEEGGDVHYLGIALEIYSALFSCDGDGHALQMDPTKNEEMRTITLRACEFSQSRDNVRLELLGENKVKLFVSSEYESFACQYGFSRYIDLGVLTNAFVLDAIAERLIGENMTLGALSSYDGYARNLDERDRKYSFSFMAKCENVVYPVCEASYSGKIATYVPKTYPTSDLDTLDFYLYSTGESAHKFIDKDSGEYKSVLPELLLASSEADCASLGIKAYQTLVNSTFDKDLLVGVSAVWLDGKTVRHIGDGLELSSAYSDEKISFNIE